MCPGWRWPSASATLSRCAIDWFRLRFEDREDRRHGEVAAAKRDEVVVQERAKYVEKHPWPRRPSRSSRRWSACRGPSAPKRNARPACSSDLPGDSTLPPLALLDEAPPAQETVAVETLEFTSRLIEKKLSDFGVEAKVVAAYPGPVVTRYEIEPATGVKGSQIVNLARDLARSLSLTSIRVVETIPGKNYMALELPNPKRQIVRLTEILGSKVYDDSAVQPDRRAGQGHRRQAGGRRPGQDAAPAGGRHHRFG